MSGPVYVDLEARSARARLWYRMQKAVEPSHAANLLLRPELCRYLTSIDADRGPVVVCEVCFPTISWTPIWTWDLSAFDGTDLEAILDALTADVVVPTDTSELL